MSIRFIGRGTPDGVMLPRYDTVYYRIFGGNQVRDLDRLTVNQAVGQAFGIWSEHVPIQFLPWSEGRTQDISVTFDADEIGGALGNALITIDTAETFFVDRFAQVNDFGWGPFDMVFALTHEIGHNFFDLNHSEVPASIMSSSIGENATRRRLAQEDIELAQARHGRVQSAAPLQFDVSRGEIISSSSSVATSVSANGYAIEGEAGTIAIIQFYLPSAKGKKSNAITLEFGTSDRFAVVSAVEIFDFIRHYDRSSVSYSSYRDEVTWSDFRLGIPSKRVFEHGCICRIEVRFMREMFTGHTSKQGQRHSVTIRSLTFESVMPALPEHFEVFRAAKKVKRKGK